MEDATEKNRTLIKRWKCSMVVGCFLQKIFDSAAETKLFRGLGCVAEYLQSYATFIFRLR